MDEAVGLGPLEHLLADPAISEIMVNGAKQVFEAMLGLSDSRGTAFVIVTHDPSLAARAGRVLELRDGILSTR